MKKFMILWLVLLCVTLDLRAQEYLIFKGHGESFQDYDLLLLKKISESDTVGHSNKVVKFKDSYFSAGEVIINDEPWELYPCCEMDTISPTGMLQYRSALQNNKGQEFVNRANVYQKMIDSIYNKLKKGEGKSLKINSINGTIKIYSVNANVCNCILVTTHNTKTKDNVPLYHNLHLLKKIETIKQLSKSEKKMFREQVNYLSSLIDSLIK